MCYANLPDGVMPTLEAERAALGRAFVCSGVTDRKSFESLLPLERYARLLGAMQLNSFGLATADGCAEATLLLGRPACLFNHSCEPNVGVSLNARGGVEFCTLQPVEAGSELEISYVSGEWIERPASERVAHLLATYGFECSCPRCRVS